MMAMMVGFVLLCGGLVVWLVQQTTHPAGPPAAPELPNSSDARRILDERFARGEIDEAD